MDHSDHKNEIKNASIKVITEHAHLLLELIGIIQKDIDRIKEFCLTCAD
jgi:hypothetical protein